MTHNETRVQKARTHAMHRRIVPTKSQIQAHGEAITIERHAVAALVSMRA
jgi:hypothetical protein